MLATVLVVALIKVGHNDTVARPFARLEHWPTL